MTSYLAIVPSLWCETFSQPWLLAPYIFCLFFYLAIVEQSWYNRAWYIFFVMLIFELCMCKPCLAITSLFTNVLNVGGLPYISKILSPNLWPMVFSSSILACLKLLVIQCQHSYRNCCNNLKYKVVIFLPVICIFILAVWNYTQSSLVHSQFHSYISTTTMNSQIQVCSFPPRLTCSCLPASAIWRLKKEKIFN